MKTKTVDSVSMKGRLCLKYIRNGTVIDISQDNLIVTQGKNNLAKLLGGQTGIHVTHVGVGTGSNSVVSTDTGITNAVKVAVTETRIGSALEAEDGTTFDDPRIVQFHFRFGLAIAVGVAIHEYGLFCADNTLFSRVVRESPFVKTAIDQIIGFWQIQF